MIVIKRDGHVMDYDRSVIAKAVEIFCNSMSDPQDDELENFRNYLRVMSELDWPAFFEYDPFFHKTILQCVEDNDMERLLLTLHERFDSAYLRDLERRLYASPVIADQRMPPIHEAFYLYRHKRYYGAGSIFVDQMEGVIKDIEEYVCTRQSGYSKKTLALATTFYRVDKSRNRADGGTGLGLTIVRAAVRAHGGSCEVENLPTGVRFRVVIPQSVLDSNA